MCLDKTNLRYAEAMEKLKPAVVITAEKDGKYYSDHSRPCDPSLIRPTIRKALAQLANSNYTYSGIYSHNGVNNVGNCAEVNVAAKVLLDHPSLTLDKINFSCARRPRTKQIVQRCQNCIDVFGKE